MIKKSLLTLSLAVSLGVLSLSPVYAQQPGGNGEQGGLFGGLGQFFQHMFHPNDSQGSQTPGQGEDQGSPVAGGVKKDATASGKPSSLQMEDLRLRILVQQGKITSSQETAIINELTAVQTELKNWATSQGIDPSYVLLTPPMMGIQGGEQGGQQGNVSNSTQARPPMRPFQRPSGSPTQNGDQ